MRPLPRAPEDHEQRNQHEHRRTLRLTLREIQHRLEKLEADLAAAE